jgi:hypothetical protein
MSERAGIPHACQQAPLLPNVFSRNDRIKPDETQQEPPCRIKNPVRLPPAKGPQIFLPEASRLLSREARFKISKSGSLMKFCAKMAA